MNKKIEQLLQQATMPGAPQIGIDDIIDYELFAELIVEECVRLAEEHSRVYTGENNEGAGCYGAANAIRAGFRKHNE